MSLKTKTQNERVGGVEEIKTRGSLAKKKDVFA